MVALVRGFHGIRGGVRVEVLTDTPAARYAPGTVLHPEGSGDALTIVEARPAEPGWVLQFRELRSRNAAEVLRDRYLEVDATALKPLPRGRYYWHELVGVEVRDPAGAPLGTVRDVYRAGGSEMLVVEGGPRGAFDLPVAKPFVRVFAPRRGQIVVDAEALDLPELHEIRPPAPPRPPRPRRATRRRPAVPMPPPRPKPAPEGEGPVEASDAADPAPPSDADPAPPSGVVPE